MWLACVACGHVCMCVKWHAGVVDTHRDVRVGRQPQRDVGERGGRVESQGAHRPVCIQRLVKRPQLLQGEAIEKGRGREGEMEGTGDR